MTKSPLLEAPLKAFLLHNYLYVFTANSKGDFVLKTRLLIWQMATYTYIG